MGKLNEFLHQVNQLKRVRRTGWVRHGVKAAESVADHSYGMSVLILLLTGDTVRIDRGRCLALAAVHDLAETIVGDIAPFDGIAAEEKLQREKAAMEQLARQAGNQELLDLWNEYVANQTPEAQLVHEADALEMASQAISYRRNGELPPQDAEPFLRSARAKIHSQAARQLLQQIMEQGNPI